MASFAAKQVVKQVAKGIGCSKDDAETLGNIAKWGTAFATGDLKGLLIDRAWRKYKDERDYVRQYHAILPQDERCYESEQDEDVEVEGIDKEGHHTDLALIFYMCAILAKAAYKDESMEDQYAFVKCSHLIRDLQKPSKLRFFSTTDTEIHVCLLQDGTLVFAFRGTELIDQKCPLGDIFTDLEQKQVPLVHYNASEEVACEAHSSVRVHKGFLMAFQDVTKTSRRTENLSLVAEGLGVKAADVKRVVCTGHSLGAAEATLCAHWCRNVAYKNAEIWCVTFGSPRVGNRAFAENFNKNVTQRKNSYRIVNKGDWVPSIPILVMGGEYPCMFYKHVEGAIYLSEHPTSKDTIILKHGGRRPIFTLPSLMDHRTEAYLNSVDKLLATVYNDLPCPN